jgi:hypothetical protein
MVAILHEVQFWANVQGGRSEMKPGKLIKKVGTTVGNAAGSVADVAGGALGNVAGAAGTVAKKGMSMVPGIETPKRRRSSPAKSKAGSATKAATAKQSATTAAKSPAKASGKATGAKKATAMRISPSGSSKPRTKRASSGS